VVREVLVVFEEGLEICLVGCVGGVLGGEGGDQGGSLEDCLEVDRPIYKQIVSISLVTRRKSVRNGVRTISL
jgi:hypothetical protein